MQQKHLDLILVVTIAFMNIIWALLPNYMPIIGVILAFPLVFMLPGYALTEALLDRNSSFDNTYHHHFILSLGLSVTIDIISGLALNLLPLGLKAISWAVCLSVLTVIFSLLAAYRRHRFITTRIHISKLPTLQPPISIRRYFFVGLCLITVITAAILSVELSISSAAQQPHPNFTQLWMLPSPSSGKYCEVSLGVQSFEAGSVKYRIVMMLNNVQVNTWSAVVLAPEEKWERTITIAQASKNSNYVEVVVYRSTNPLIIYREVHMTLSNMQKDKKSC